MLSRSRLSTEVIICVFLTILLLFPYMVVFSSIGGLHGAEFLSYIVNERVISLIQSSLSVSILVALVSSALGLIIVSCIVLSHSELLGRLLLVGSGITFCISPVVIISALQVIPWMNEMAPLWKVVAILSWSYFAIPVFIIWRTLHNLDIPGLEYGRLCSEPYRIIRFLILPQLTMPLLISSLIVFIFTFMQSEVPSLLGYPVYAEEFLARIILEDTLGPAVMLALPMIMVTLLILPFLIWHGRRLIVPSWKTGGIRLLQELFHPGWSFKVASPFILLFIISPIAVLFWHSEFHNFTSSTATTIISSIYLAVPSTLLAVLLAYLIVEGIAAFGSFYQVILIGIFLVQILLPGSLFGIGMIGLSQWPSMYWLKTGDLLLILSHALRVLPLLVLLLLSLRQQNSMDKIQELKLMGIGWFRRQIHIRLPEMKSNLFIAVALGFTLVLSELSTTILVITPGTETIILRLYNLMHYGDWKSVSALALVQAMIVTIILLFTFLQGQRSSDKN